MATDQRLTGSYASINGLDLYYEIDGSGQPLSTPFKSDGWYSEDRAAMAAISVDLFAGTPLHLGKVLAAGRQRQMSISSQITRRIDSPENNETWRFR